MGRSIYFTDLEIEKLIDYDLIQLNCWEKQIPVKPIILDELNGDIDYECPLCGKQVMSDAESRNNYCGECGCKFDWSEIDETD